ncbi:Ig-like domain-containing protein [Paenibacillus protaetiae]|uniref:SLH domain-containing protein n=1 Tax=Paenibacillus protaetiae TaxID=2509456 RepID=A0A4P6EXE9_9BACL|nr:Ig-like domain-containing protein [Paenibacillus protaetiae]QAY67744.1 hypothetical protein ET464_16475 [Paenibacillus protaetiae]
MAVGRGLGGGKAYAAAGPAIVSQSPANNYTNTSLSSALTLTFDESVTRGTGNASVSLYKNATNELVESFVVSSSSRITLDSAKRMVTIRPTQALQLNTDYYVLIDWGAFVSESSGTPFAGISSARDWTFHTVQTLDVTRPSLTSKSPDVNETNVPITSAITLQFSEPVYAAQGDIVLQSTYDHREISVTSSAVQGSGTSTILVSLAELLYSQTTYTLTIANGLFQDAAGNALAAQSWSFKTAAAPVNISGEVSPANQATMVPVTSALSVTFDQPVSAASNKYIEIRRVSDNVSIEKIAASSSRVTISGNTVTIRPSTLAKGTAYYVLVDPGAFYKTGTPGDIFPGIVNATRWMFVTDPGPDSVAPTVKTLTPAHQSVIGGLTTKLQMEFSEPVYPDSGSIEIRNAANGALYKTISVTSNLVTGGGSTQITIDPGIAFNKDAQYYVVIGGRVFRDAAGNYYSGMAARSWLFTTTEQDTTAPVFSSASRSGAYITLTYNEVLNSSSIPSVSSFIVTIDGSSRAIQSVSVSGKTVTLRMSGSISDSQTVKLSYTRPGSGGIQDPSGNQAASLSTRTIQTGYTEDDDDDTSPVLTYIEASGRTVTLKYNEELNSTYVPSTSRYSVVADGNAISVNQVIVSGVEVVLTLSQFLTNSSTIKVSYTASGTRVQDLYGNYAASFSSRTANTYDYSEDPPITRAVLTGNLVKLTFQSTMDSSAIPAVTQFVIKAGSLPVRVTKVSISGKVVTLTLQSSPDPGDAVYVTYSQSTTGLKTNGGTPIASFVNVEVDNQTSIDDALADGLELTDDGQVALDASAAAVKTVMTPSGNYASRYTFDPDLIADAWTASRIAGNNPTRIMFQVPSSQIAGMVAVPLTALQTISYSDSQATFAVYYKNLVYEVPVSALNYSELYQVANGTVMYLLIELERGAMSETNMLKNAVSGAQGSLITDPYYMKASVMGGTKIVPIDNFKNYFNVRLTTGNAVTSGYSSLVLFDTQAGKVMSAPTSFTAYGGSTIASSKIRGNGAFALVKGSSPYTDVSSHWAVTTIRSLASKFVVEGTSAAKYEPNKAITRGEFAMFIAKGLGLPGKPSAASKFIDVNAGTAMGAYIGAASSAGIVQGTSGNTFNPNSYITREDMAVMMMRAASVAGSLPQLGSTESSYLQRFTDRGSIGSWARTSVAQAVYAGIIAGMTPSTFSPKTNATRAEAAVMLERLLKYAKLI